MKEMGGLGHGGYHFRCINLKKTKQKQTKKNVGFKRVKLSCYNTG